MKRLKPRQTAAREAYEEAGVVGRVAAKPCGSFVYRKWLEGDDSVDCEVQVFALRVKRQLKSWPEQRQREVRWFTLNEACASVDLEGLRCLIGVFARSCAVPVSIHRRRGQG